MINKFGEKIRKKRLELGLTQKSVASDFMTRNMLSMIEAGRTMPSLETAEYLAKTLDLPLSYLVSDEDTFFVFDKQRKISDIRRRFKNGEYESCLSIIESISDTDDELAYVNAFCLLRIGRQKLFHGSLASAVRYFSKALEMASKTCYDTAEIKATVPLYLAVANNIHSPLLELDSDAYENIYSGVYDYDFFKYVTLDSEYEFKNENYRKHLYAKQLLKKYSYYEAIAVLRELEESKNKDYNACVLFGVYSDLEIAFKQIGDFENAYRYASKKLSLISAFKE